MTLDPHLSPLIKLDQVKQRNDLETLKAIEENISSTLEDTDLGKNFLDRTPFTKKKIKANN